MTPNQQPKASRPHMPDYGISKKKAGLQQWSWVDDQLTRSRNYWICSTRPDGRPHAAPVWGVWMDGALYFGSSLNSAKGRNFQHSPHITVHLESGDDVVILEGLVMRLEDEVVFTNLRPLYKEKYGFDLGEDLTQASPLWVFRPANGFSWQEVSFPNTATRWSFE